MTLFESERVSYVPRPLRRPHAQYIPTLKHLPKTKKTLSIRQKKPKHCQKRRVFYVTCSSVSHMLNICLPCDTCRKAIGNAQNTSKDEVTCNWAEIYIYIYIYICIYIYIVYAFIHTCTYSANLPKETCNFPVRILLHICTQEAEE